MDPKINQVLDKIYQQKKKLGVILTVNQLFQYAKKVDVNIKQNDVRQYLNTQELSARFSTPAKKPSRFQTINHPKIGLYFLDYAEFHKDNAWHNKNNTGFLVAVENITNRLFVYPCKGKNTSQWENAVEQFVDIVQNVSVIYTDRDAVATSKTFRENIYKLYQIKWYFMAKGSKSYLAERYIRYVKEKLSQALIIKNTKNWIQFVTPIIQEHNNEIIEGTSFKRSAITKNNFNDFLTQRLKINKNTKFIQKYLPNIKVSDDPTLLINSARIYSDFISKDWNDSIFTYKTGDKVYLARRSDWKNKKIGAFFKASHWGAFGPDIYTISNRQLRAVKNFKGYVPVYSLKEIGSEHFFYASELKKAVHEEKEKDEPITKTKTKKPKQDKHKKGK